MIKNYYIKSIGACESRVDEIVRCYKSLYAAGLAPAVNKISMEDKDSNEWGYKYTRLHGEELEIANHDFDFPRLGRFIAEIHESLKKIVVRKIIEFNSISALETADGILNCHSRVEDSLISTVKLKKERIISVPTELASRLTRAVDKQTIHGDIHKGNVIVNENQWKVIDLDRAAICNPIYEVTRAVVLLKDFELDLPYDEDLQSTLQGYCESRGMPVVDNRYALTIYYLIQMGDFYGLGVSTNHDIGLQIFAEKRSKLFHQLDYCLWPLGYK